MSNMAPDLSGLDPFINAFIVVAVIGALVSLVIIGEAVVSFVRTNRRERVARHESVPAYYRRLVTTH
jgi:sorbitol-specific phosphotransferase system component IIC